MKLIYREFNLFSKSKAPIIAPLFNNLESGGRFYCNMARAFFPEVYIPRIGEWSSPWKTDILPKWKIPNLTEKFYLNFSEVTDNRAIEVKKIIEDTGKECVVFYSGGIDSTVVLASLIKNLDSNTLKKIKISMSAESIIENPYFYKKYIENKFHIIDSNKYLYSDILKNLNCFCISADVGDFIYGTEIGVKLYPRIRSLKQLLDKKTQKVMDDLYRHVSSNEIHFSEFKELLILYFNTNLQKGINDIQNYNYLPRELLSKNDDDLNFGELFYKKLTKNIESCNAPVHSLHDFFWWSMFNQRFIWGIVRPAFNYCLEDNLETIINTTIFSWFAGNEYQLWSLNNNNNGEKMKGTTQSSYKWASRNYIYDFDKNDWYKENKIKMPSMPVLLKSNWKKYFEELDNKFGITDDYSIVRVGNRRVDDFIRKGIVEYNIDWI